MENFINRLDSFGTSGVGVNELVNVLGKYYFTIKGYGLY